MDLNDQLSTTRRGSTTDEEPQPSLAGALSLSSAILGRATKAESNYTPEGPYPFTCGNCKYIVWGNRKDGADLCQLVSGTIRPDAACRLFDAKPDYKQQGDGSPDLKLVGTYSEAAPTERQTRLKPSRLNWRIDRMGWSETGEPRNE